MFEDSQHNIYYRTGFQILFKQPSITHFNQTVSMLLDRIFSSSTMDHQTSWYIYLNEKTARASLLYRIGYIIEGTKNGDSLKSIYKRGE